MTEEKEVTRLEPRFAAVVKSFAKDRSVSHGGSKGFGSGALKVNGKIFAMGLVEGGICCQTPHRQRWISRIRMAPEVKLTWPESDDNQSESTS